MNQRNQLTGNTLFLALTRPPMVKGIPMEAFFLNIIVTLCAFILSKQLWVVLIWIPLHATCFMLCLMDKQIFSILLCNSRLIKAGNKSLWNGVSYEPF